MPKTYTLEEARAAFEAKGGQFTPAVEQEMRRRGMIVDPPAPPPVNIGARANLAGMLSGIPGMGPALAANIRGGDIENPATSAIRSGIEIGSLGYYDPLAGEPWGQSVPARIGRGVGAGGAVAAQFAATAPLAAPLQALRFGRLIAPAAQFGALGVARAPSGGQGEGEAAGGIMDQVLERLKTGGEEAATGALLSTMHFLPELVKNPTAQAALKKVLSSPVADVGVVGGMNAAQMARQGNFNWGDLALETIPFVAGMRFGNAAAHAVNPKMGMNAQQREEYDAREMAQQMARQREAQAVADNQRQAQFQADVEGRQRVFDEARQWREAEMAASAARQAEQSRLDAAEMQRQQREQSAQDAYWSAMEAPGEAARQQTESARKSIEESQRAQAESGPQNIQLSPEDAAAAAASVYRQPFVQPDYAREAGLTALGTQTFRQPDYTKEADSVYRTPFRKPNPNPEASAEYKYPLGVKWSNLNSLGGQDVYEALKRMSDRAGDRRRANSAAREQRVRDLAEKMLDAAERGQPIGGFEDYQRALGLPVGPTGGINRPATGAKHETIEGEPESAPTAEYLNRGEGALEWSRKMRDLGVMSSANTLKQILVDGKIGKLNIGSAQWLDRRRALRRAFGGEFDTPANMSTLRVGEQLERAREQMEFELSARMLKAHTSAGIRRGTPEAEAVQRLGELATDHSISARAAAATDEGRAILSKVQNPEQVLSTLDAVGKEYALQAEIRNNIHVAVGQKPAEMRKFYYGSRTERRYSKTGKGATGFKGKAQEIAFAIEQATRDRDLTMEPSQKPRVWSPREMRRGNQILAESEVNRDPFDVALQYTKDTARVATNTVALTKGELVADAIRQRAENIREADPMRAAELDATADAVSAITQMSYNGKLLGIGGKMQEALYASRGARTTGIVDAALKSSFNASRYLGNLQFMSLTQWTSVFMAGSQGGLTLPDIGRALAEMGTKRLRDEYRNSYTHWAKTRNTGSVLHEGEMQVGRVGNPLENYGKSTKSKIGEKIKISAGKPVVGIEDFVGRMTYALAEQIGIKAGLSGQKLQDFKSDTVGLTQSYYDRVNRAALLSTPILNTMFPAQGFAFDVANSIADVRQGIAGTKATMTPKEKAAALGRIAFGMAAANAIYALVKSDEESAGGIAKDVALQSITGSVPYAGSLLGIGGMATGRAYPAQAVADMQRAVQFFAEGDYERGLAMIAGDFAPGGSQGKRIVEANYMIENGVIREDEKWDAYVYGWQSTESGKRYMRMRSGKSTAADRAYRPDYRQWERQETKKRSDYTKRWERDQKRQQKEYEQDQEYYRRGGR